MDEITTREKHKTIKLKIIIGEYLCDIDTGLRLLKQDF